MPLFKRGKVITTEGVEPQDNYKYLRVPQANGTQEEVSRKSAMTKYLQRARQVLKGQLKGKKSKQSAYMPCQSSYTGSWYTYLAKRGARSH